MEDKNAARCKQCDHLLSFHGEDGCGTWLLGVRAVPLYRCACVVSVSAKPKAFPSLTTGVIEPPAKRPESDRRDEGLVSLAALKPASEAAPPHARERLLEVAAELRRTAEELKSLEGALERALRRLKAAEQGGAVHAEPPAIDRRVLHDRRRRDYAMIVDRRVVDRRAA